MAAMGPVAIQSSSAAESAKGAEAHAGVPLPELQADPPGTVIPRSCTLSVMAGHVSVELLVATTTDMPALLLSGPLFGFDGSAAPYAERQFPELAIRVDGASSVPDDRFEAFFGGRNITNFLIQADLDPWIITHDPPVTAAHPAHPQVLKGLILMGAIEPVGEDFRAKWTARRILRIPLKNVPQQRVELDYTARPAAAVMTAEQLDTAARERRYCLSPRELAKLRRPGAGTTWLSIQELAIATGIDDTAPAAVSLTVQPTAARGNLAPTVFACGPHGKSVAKQGRVTREAVDVDDSGSVHVLIVALAAGPPAAVR